DTLLNVFVLVPMSTAEESLTYTEDSLRGRVGKIIVPIPEGGFGEIVIRSKSGLISKPAAHYDTGMIDAGKRVLVIDNQQGVLLVVPYEDDTYRITYTHNYVNIHRLEVLYILIDKSEGKSMYFYGDMFGVWVVVIIVLVLVIALISVFISKYRTAVPDEALIVTGSYLGTKNVHLDVSGNKVKIIRCSGTFVLPVFQQAEPLRLISSKLDVKTPEVYTEQGVPVMADGTAIIKIGGSISEIATAAEQFLGKSKEDREI